jgi:hypothetical protein
LNSSVSNPTIPIGFGTDLTAFAVGFGDSVVDKFCDFLFKSGFNEFDDKLLITNGFALN